MAMAVFPVLQIKRPVSGAIKRRKRGWVDEPRGASNQHGAAGNLALLDHLQNNGGGFPCLFLTDKTLRGGARLESNTVDTKSPDVRVRGDEVEAAKLLGLGDGHHGLEKMSVPAHPKHSRL
jgi:hypothetical protein